LSEEEGLGNVPRRMRRFYRQGKQPPEAAQAKQELPESSDEKIQKAQAVMKKESSALAQRELRRFKERFNRLPKNGEFDEIAENIYNQAKTQASQESKEHGRFRHAKPEAGIPAVAGKPEAGGKIPETAKKPELSIEELLKEEPKVSEKPEEKEGLELSDLNLKADDLQKTLDELPEDSESFLKETKSEINNCPNCSTKTEHLIFCPECGAAFCTHCAKQAKALEDKISYVCPKCNAEFKARKTE